MSITRIGIGTWDKTAVYNFLNSNAAQIGLTFSTDDYRVNCKNGSLRQLEFFKGPSGSTITLTAKYASSVSFSVSSAWSASNYIEGWKTSNAVVLAIKSSSSATSYMGIIAFVKDKNGEPIIIMPSGVLTDVDDMVTSTATNAINARNPKVVVSNSAITQAPPEHKTPSPTNISNGTIMYPVPVVSSDLALNYCPNAFIVPQCQYPITGRLSIGNDTYLSFGCYLFKD